MGWVGSRLECWKYRRKKLGCVFKECSMRYRFVGSWGLWIVMAATMSACGGGGGGGSSGGSHSLVTVGTSSGSMYVAGTFMPSSQFKGKCALPRSGNSQ